MKHSLGSVLKRCLLVASLIVAASCSPGPKGKAGQQYQIIWPTADGHYEIQKVQIDTFGDPSRLKGEFASLLVEPRIGAAGLEGERPVGRFIRSSGGVLVPADFITHQGTVVYAHMERLHRLDREVGIEGGSFVWPAKIGLRANVADAQGPLQNNAIYDGLLNALLLVPYTDTGLPITLNGGVLAHEHFHSIFQHYVLSSLGTQWHGLDAAIHVCGIDETPSPEIQITRIGGSGSRDDKLAREVTELEYNRFLIRGLNEGFADFWGWIYSGDPKFIQRSLMAAGQVRDLSQDMDALPSRETIRSSLRRLTQPRARSSLSYTFGSHYARFMRRLVEAQSASHSVHDRAAQLEVARALKDALPVIAHSFKTGFGSEFIAPEVALKPLLSALQKVTPDSCALLESFVSSRVSSSIRPADCPLPAGVPAEASAVEASGAEAIGAEAAGGDEEPSADTFSSAPVTPVTLTPVEDGEL
ncbi:MAG: hypothetical protein NDI61_12195 [Bdellovibrionaceae bacterium]|nr:hypothetical protein [Pseudobdellovibrionaceae bacterium]